MGNHGIFGGSLSTEGSLEIVDGKEKEGLTTNEIWREHVDSKAERAY